MTNVVSAEAVREAGQLITIDDAMNILRTTEPLNEFEFNLDGSDRVQFRMPDGWNEGIEDLGSSDLTDCTIRLDSNEYPLTKEALFTMTSSIGLQKPYVSRTPGPLLEPHINFWVNNNGVAQTDAMRLMVNDGAGVAFIKASKATFPNIPVVEQVLGKIESHFGIDSSTVMVDYKMAHSLERTGLRLIVPEIAKTIRSVRHGGVDDNWSLGIQVTNSLIGHPETRLNVSGYLFAWWCTNGAISTHASSGNYNRRVQGQDFAEVIEWVGSSTESIFSDLKLELDDVESLTEVSLTGELNDVMLDVFKQFKVPVASRQPIISALVESDDLTGYGLMQAITQSANRPDVTDKVAESAMRVGGVVPGVLTERCSMCHRLHVS